MNEYSFEKLEIYQCACKLRKEIYNLAKKLPDYERYNLVEQMCRAALSLTNNIAEGHGRLHYQENIQFLRQSRGSFEELIDDITVCIEEDYSDTKDLIAIKELGYELLKNLNGYIKYLKNRKTNTQSQIN